VRRCHLGVDSTIMVKGMAFSSLAFLVAFVGADDLTSNLQAVLDEMVSSHLAQYPTLSMSFAWKDGETEVAVASGKVLGRAATVDDTYLYGSGTKPVTAASIMRVIDQGLVKADDKVYTILDPYLKRMGKPSTEEYFGPEFKNSTVLSLIRMSAGIRDFEDDYSFDKEVLADSARFWRDYPYDAMNFSVSAKNVAGGGGSGPLICPTDGECSSYSSTSYDVAGLVLTALVEPEKLWSDFDLGSVLFPDRSKVPSMKFPNGGEKISASLTVPGSSVSPAFSPEPITIYEQDASILGFTCGNMAARPTDMARFFYWLLDAEGDEEVHLISRAAAAEMTRTQLLTRGWAHGYLAYGAGIQDRSYGDTRNKKAVAVKGHEGETYAFVSASGYVPELKGGFSLIANTDVGNLPINGACPMLEVVKRFVTGNASVDLGCRAFASDDIVV